MSDKPSEARSVRGNDINPKTIGARKPVKSVNAEEARTERPFQTILDGDDLQDIVESADPFTRFVIEPDTGFNITPPFDPPEGTFLDAGTTAFGTGTGVVLRKAGDGNLVNVPEYFQAKGIRFNGRGSDHDGDGLVDAEWNTGNCILDHCYIHDMEGDGRVHDAHAYARYYNLRIRGCGGHAIRNMTTDYDGFRRSYIELEANDNDGGTLKIESGDRQNRYFLRTYGSGGAGVHIDPGENEFVRDLMFMGSIESHDDPAFYGESGEVGRVLFKNLHISQNGTNPSLPTGSPVGGAIHVDGADGGWHIHTSGGSMGTGSSSDVLINGAEGGSDARIEISAIGTNTLSGHTVEGNVIATLPDGMNWSADFNGVDGYKIHSNNPGNGVIETFRNGERWYMSSFDSPPIEDARTGSVYLDMGGSTDDGDPAYRVFDGTNWVDL